MTLALIVLALAFGLAFLPQLWIRGVIARHSDERADIAGTGGEFARHVLDGMGLHHVVVEETQSGDHYDPDAKAVRLLPQHFGKRSLAAIVIAAHEVGHAMQDATAYGPLIARTRMARQAQKVEKVGSVIMLAAPVMMILSKSPHIMFMQLAIGVLILGSTIFMHAVTLPVEFDASFRRALPLLKTGNYISNRDMRSARQLLRAAAFTYVAAAAVSLLDVMRWFRVLRF
ncbi:MAG: zinc metallopeptidase [Hyphomicrobium sp.]|uniref:zinc metallopeptidase n=1 Tax=Hyphomicrobium sp. CS1BSMeth3 TaxID=1892844 RepID=UPI0009313C85|nr:zinc metallopeptidase [Hyphomicrobium sp. CS1BSMeth3]MBN9275635.1 zinc metallopeptidase [Mesorhizobium sp.]MBN9278232.1 zinc metallopeptidase [Hyphomicrobium sp.]